MKSIRITTAVVATLLLAGACGGSSKKVTSGQSQPAEASSTTVPSAANDQPILDAIILQTADVQGWTSQPSQSSSPTDAADSAAFAQCVGTRDTFPDNVASSSSTFTIANAGDEIDSSASSFKSADAVASDTAAFSSPKMSSCLSDRLQAAMGEGLKSTGAKLGQINMKITPGSGAAHVVALMDGTVGLTVGSHTGTVYLSLVFLASGRFEAELDFLTTLTPINSDLKSELVSKVSSRLPSS